MLKPLWHQNLDLVLGSENRVETLVESQTPSAGRLVRQGYQKHRFLWKRAFSCMCFHKAEGVFNFEVLLPKYLSHHSGVTLPKIVFFPQCGACNTFFVAGTAL